MTDIIMLNALIIVMMPHILEVGIIVWFYKKDNWKKVAIIAIIANLSLKFIIQFLMNILNITSIISGALGAIVVAYISLIWLKRIKK